MKNKLKKLLFFSSFVTFIFFLINKFISTISVLKDILNKGHGNYYEWRFGNIYYTRQGHGSPILLIHDLDVSSSSYEWKEVIKSLSKTHTVYAVDLLGCGRSDKPVITYTNFMYVQMISDFIKNIIGSKSDIIATGLSGSFSVMICNNEPDIINRIIMINPESIQKINQVQTKRKKALKLMLNTPIFGTSIYNAIVSKYNIEQMFENKLFYKYSKICQSDIDAYYESCHIHGSTAKYLHASIKGGYLNANIVHALKSVNNSIFIIGSTEITDNISLIQNYVCYNASIETAFIEKTGMLPQLETPEKLLDQINLFLS